MVYLPNDTAQQFLQKLITLLTIFIKFFLVIFYSARKPQNLAFHHSYPNNADEERSANNWQTFNNKQQEVHITSELLAMAT